MPEDAYAGSKNEGSQAEEKHGMIDNIKHKIGL